MPTSPVGMIPVIEHTLCGQWQRSTKGAEHFSCRNCPWVRPFQLNTAARDWYNLFFKVQRLPQMEQCRLLPSKQYCFRIWLHNCPYTSHRQYNYLCSAAYSQFSAAFQQEDTIILVSQSSMQVTKGTWCMHKQSIPGSFPPSLYKSLNKVIECDMVNILGWNWSRFHPSICEQNLLIKNNYLNTIKTVPSFHWV